MAEINRVPGQRPTSARIGRPSPLYATHLELHNQLLTLTHATNLILHAMNIDTKVEDPIGSARRKLEVLVPYTKGEKPFEICRTAVIREYLGVSPLCDLKSAENDIDCANRALRNQIFSTRQDLETLGRGLDVDRFLREDDDPVQFAKTAIENLEKLAELSPKTFCLDPEDVSFLKGSCNSTPFISGRLVGGGYLWNEACFGAKLRVTDPRSDRTREMRSKEFFRGYIQITPDQLPRVVEILNKIAQTRLHDGKTTMYKVLLGCSSNPSELNAGKYVDLYSDESVLVVYGADQSAVFELFQAISSDVGWRQIEDARRNDSWGRGHRCRLTSDWNGWKTLCFNPYRGERSAGSLAELGPNTWRKRISAEEPAVQKPLITSFSPPIAAE